MKGLFPEYAAPSSDDYREAWKQALFVFDTNVLLNLYRYQQSARVELLNVLGQLSDRIWIPHHVALEFQRNRLKVIAEQNKRFSDVRRIVDKARSSLFSELEKLQLNKRHALIDPQQLTTGFENLVDIFLKELESLRETQQKLSDPDPLQEQIETLFDGRVGAPPKDQAEIDELYARAAARFKLQIPPGYLDADKDKDEPDAHVHGGIVYKRKFGDYLIWQQILSHAKGTEAKSVIFITDDGKDDWWRKVDSDGTKIIGPRPELIDEARLSASLEQFFMYGPEGFLKYAKEFLKAQVSEATLDEVRDVSTGSPSDLGHQSLRDFAIRAGESVLAWLEPQFDVVLQNLGRFPDFVARRGGETYGFEVRAVNRPKMIRHHLEETVYRAYHGLMENRFTEIAIVWVLRDSSGVEELKWAIKRALRDKMPDTLRMIIGVLVEHKPGIGALLVCDDFRPSDLENIARGPNGLVEAPELPF